MISQFMAKSFDQTSLLEEYIEEQWVSLESLKICDGGYEAKRISDYNWLQTA